MCTSPHQEPAGCFVDRHDAFSELDGIVASARGDDAPAIAGECHEGRAGVIAAPADHGGQVLVPEQLARPALPDPDDPVGVACYESIAGRRPRGRSHPAHRRPLVVMQPPAGPYLEQGDGVVDRHGDEGPVGGKDWLMAPPARQCDRLLESARLGIENPQQAEIADRHMFAIARQGRMAETMVLLAVQILDVPSGLEIPESDLGQPYIAGAVFAPSARSTRFARPPT